MPKLASGPATLVRLFAPLPSPGLMRSPHVALGYLGDPELTAARFVVGAVISCTGSVG